MSYKISSKLVYFAALVLSASAHANLVVTSGQWVAPVTATEATGAFWDQKSKDGSNCNVGFWLQDPAWATGVSTRCSSDSFVGTDFGPGPLAFLAGDAGGTTATDWSFQAAGNGKNFFTLRLEVAGNRNLNTFGWVNGAGVMTELYNGLASPNSNAAVDITVSDGEQFYFYLCPGGNCGQIIYSNTVLGGPNDNKAGKFALFSEIPKTPTSTSKLSKYWIGVEDSAGSGGLEARGDYNDFVISATVVPEPGFYGALSVGLGGLFMLVRRRRQSAN